jgi:hypothetical protein
MDKMYCYLWHEKTDVNECKFGERWVKEGQDPNKEVLKRIKDSVGVRKDKIKDGTIELIAIWDVTELAQKNCPDRLKQHGRVDDYIREQIGFRKGTTGEVHTLDATVMAYKVNEYLKKVGQPLPVAGLAQWQYDQANAVIDAVKLGKRIILAELCARFGKTIWAGALAIETGAKVTIIASYVLTSFASFAKDLNQFEQFRDMEIIDSGDDNYKKQIKDALKEGRQVVMFLSMCGGSLRQDRIDFIFGLKENRLVFIDEADFGAHTDKQADPFIVAKKPQDVVVLMTGTNGERACGNWNVGGAEGYYIGTTYAELLMERAGV